MLTYNIQNTLKLKEEIPDNVQNIINIFRENVIDHFDYKVERVIQFQAFIENKNRFISIFNSKKTDKDLGVFNSNNKFFKDPFYQEYLLEREALFAAEFESLLSWIENRYSVLKELTNEDGTLRFNSVRAFRKAVSGGICSGRNFYMFQVGLKFFKQHFSFIHGTFRERNFDLFHGEKKKFIRMELSKKLNTFISINTDINDPLSLSLKYHRDIFSSDFFKEVNISFNCLKEKFLFISLYNKYVSYTNVLSINPYIPNAIYSMGLSKASKRKIFLTYSMIDDHAIELNTEVISLKLKNKEYLTDYAYKFRKHLSLSGKIHPISLATNHDYVDFSAFNLDLFMSKILSSDGVSFLNNFKNFYLNKTHKLFKFIDLYGQDFTRDILLRDFSISEHTNNYKFIKQAHDLNLNIYLSNSMNHLFSKFVVCDQSLSPEDCLLWENNLTNDFNNLMKENLLDNTDFKYYNQPLFKKYQYLFFSSKEKTFFDSINHIFFLSLLSMTGVNIQSLSFEDCINTELKSNLNTNNQVFENFVLDCAVDNLSVSFPIINRKKHLEILSFVKKINLFLSSSEWEVSLDNFERLRSFFDAKTLYNSLSEVSNLKEIHKNFLKKLRINPDIQDIIDFFYAYSISIDPEIRF